MPVSLDDLHRRLNDIYASRKIGDRIEYVAPEARPKVESNQVLALLEVLFDLYVETSDRIITIEERINNE